MQVGYIAMKKHGQKIIILIMLFLWSMTPVFADATQKKHHTKQTVVHQAKIKTHKKKLVLHTVKLHKHYAKKTTSHSKPPLGEKSFVSAELSSALTNDTHADEAVQSSPGLVNSFQHRVVGFVHKTVDTLRYSAYKLGGAHFDPTRGIYVLDCSRYVDQILQKVTPSAFLSLVNSSGSDQPNSRHYFDFFNQLPDNPTQHWSRIDEVEQLEPGDILVFRNKHEYRASGHVMVVMNKPVRDTNSFLVRVADSAPSGHSQDTRGDTSGIGIGTLLLKVNPETLEPSAYAWKVGARWQKNVDFAMARPLEINSENKRSLL